MQRRAVGRATRWLTLVAVLAAGCATAPVEQASSLVQAGPASMQSHGFPTGPKRRRTTTTTTAKRASSTAARTGTSSGSSGSLGPGARGDAVKALQQRLVDLKYFTGTDGRYGPGTLQAVMAFQKVRGIPRTGRADSRTLKAMQAATTPPPLVAGGGPERIEIDIKRQVLFLYRGGALFRILPVSTGNNKHYCDIDPATDKEVCGVAITPTGAFRIQRRIPGLRVSALGQLYNPLYFIGGYAIHGSPSVPGYPASHGCIRITMEASKWLPAQVPNKTPVYVIGARKVTPLTTRPKRTTTTTSTTSTTTPDTSTTSTPSTSSTTAPPTTTTTTTPLPTTTTTTRP